MEFRTKNLEKTWNLVIGKKCEPWFMLTQIESEEYKGGWGEGGK